MTGILLGCVKHTNISDTDTILQYCIYPLFLVGDTDIKNRLENTLIHMAKSNDVIQVYQVFSFIMSQDMLTKIYTEIPVLIEFTNVINILISRIASLENDMKIYCGNDFGGTNESLWLVVKRIIKKSDTLKA